jgi:uncharacterized protein with PIN domain
MGPSPEEHSSTGVGWRPAPPRPSSLRAELETEKGLLRVCCGNLIQPRMGEMRDPVGGRTEFVTCWRCPTCGRVRLR